MFPKNELSVIFEKPLDSFSVGELAEQFQSANFCIASHVSNKSPTGKLVNPKSFDNQAMDKWWFLRSGFRHFEISPLGNDPI